MATGRAKDPTRLSGPSVRDPRRSYVEEQYPTLIRNNRLRPGEAVRLRGEASAFGYRPLVSICMPVSNPEPGRLRRALDSVLGQVYPGWELRLCCAAPPEANVKEILSLYGRLDGRIEVSYGTRDAGASGLSNEALSLAGGELVVFLGEEDALAPEALFEVVKLLQDHPGADLVYSDSDRLDEEGNRCDPHFKPGWSPDLLLSLDYLSHLSVYRRSLLEEVGGFGRGLDGCRHHDLVLRYTELAGSVRHLPKVLYHRRTTADGDAARARGESRRVLSEALRRRGVEGSVEDGELPESFRVRPRISGEPLVSLVIPTRDNVALLKNCVESIERLTTYRNYQILIVDNDSADPETVEYLASTPHRVVPFREPFNYSRINNFAVSRAGGEYVVLLNDDTEVIAGDWLEAMLEHAQSPEVGAVGAKLLYPDDRIQHAGVIVGVGNAWGPGIAVHSHQFYPADSPGHGGVVAATANYSAVTAACMMIRKSLFEDVGGLDAENLRVSFNDIDLCLRLGERGYRIVYTPHARLYHHESVSRGYGGDPAELLYMRERWGAVMDKDPFYNPNFSRGSGDFNLRADLLRPRLLRGGDESERFVSPTTTVPEEFQRYIAERRKYVRGSRRTAITPTRGRKTIRVVPGRDFDDDGGPDPTADGGSLDGAGAKMPAAPEALRAEQLIWMFGSPRTGSTWLSRMMAELESQERWHEPYVGLLFGSFLYDRLKGNNKLLESPSFIMGEPHRKTWLASVKSFIIEGAGARYPGLKEDQYLVVKEPNGSLGAPLLLEATPESRLIFLLRDPRDVVASRLDAFKEGSWSAQARDFDDPKQLIAFTRRLANEYLRVVSGVQKAYDAHEGPKVLVRYEELRDDTVGTLKRMYDALGIRVTEAQLEAAAAKHVWEQVPETDKGPGKFYRKAKPGGWREDLTQEQVKIIENVTRPILTRHY